MKWMWSTAFVVVVSAAASAQAGSKMNGPTTADTMGMTYTGCVEAVNHGGSFLLTHVGDDRAPMMHQDHDEMMKHDAEMAKKTVALTGRSDLRKHVGQKVTVTGSLPHGMAETMSNDRDTLAVSTLKVVAKTCS